MRRGIIACIVMLASAACGSSSPAAPSTSSPPTGSINLSGTWVEKTGSLIFELTQVGSNVTGTSSFSDRNAVLGQYQASGTVTGTVAGSTLTTNEVYQLSGGPSLIGCVETVTSTWTITSDKELTGPFSQTDTCNGTVVFSKTGGATIDKQ